MIKQKYPSLQAQYPESTPSLCSVCPGSIYSEGVPHNWCMCAGSHTPIIKS